MGKDTSDASSAPAFLQRNWEILLGSLLVLVAGLLLWPMLFPRLRVPSVTKSELSGFVAPSNKPSMPERSSKPPANDQASDQANDQAASDQPTSAALQSNPVPEYPSTASVQPLTSGKVNLNTASLEQLEALPKVGRVMAERIIAGRPYRSLADLDRVKGVGEATLKQLTPLVTW